MEVSSSTPAISILCAFHNEARYLPATIESLNQQSFKNFEAIFVDDASSDGSSEIVRQQAGFPYQLLRNDVNLRLVGSLNRGLSEVRAPLVARIDADDLMLENRLAQQVAAFDQDPGLVLLGGQAIKIDDNGKAFGRWQMPTSDQDCRFLLNFTPAFIHPAVMFRHSAAMAAGGYREEWFPAEDFEFWLRLAALGRIGNLPEAIIEYRVRSSQSITSSNRTRQLEQHLAIVRGYQVDAAPHLRCMSVHLRKIATLIRQLPAAGKAEVARKALRLLLRGIAPT